MVRKCIGEMVGNSTTAIKVGRHSAEVNAFEVGNHLIKKEIFNGIALCEC